jgi:DNA-binding transcriptional ArsR family regulator
MYPDVMVTTSADQALLLDLPAQVAAAISPLRRQLLEQLVVPGSATEVAERIGLKRQKVNYHLRALETAGLIELVEERPRRGCTERILRTRARRLVVDPQLLERADPGTTPASRADLVRDRSSAAYQISAMGQAVRDVAALEQGARAADKRLALATIEADLRFDSPAALSAFADDIAQCIAQLAVKHGARADATAARPYRLLFAARPVRTKSVATRTPSTTENADDG